MHMKRMILTAALAAAIWGCPCFAPFACATVGVTDVVAKQRYPWNGLVDITCKVTGIEGTTNGLYFAVAAVMPDAGKTRDVSHFWVVQGDTNSTDRAVHVNGEYRLLWDAKVDLGIVRYTNMVVRVSCDAHEMVQLWEGGPYWATTNIGAEKPEDSGYYFWWGDTIGYKRENDAWVATDGSSQNFSFNSENTPTYNKTPATLQGEGWIAVDNTLMPEHDAAQVQWGNGWRMPTYQELYDLCYNKCDWTWMTQNGVNGYVVRGRGDYATFSIFLPAAGYGTGASLYSGSNGSNGGSGLYWSSEQGTSHKSACRLNFDTSYGPWVSIYFNYGRDWGLTVRPVQGFAK